MFVMHPCSPQAEVKLYLLSGSQWFTVFVMHPCSPLPSGTLRTPGLHYVYHKHASSYQRTKEYINRYSVKIVYSHLTPVLRVDCNLRFLNVDRVHWTLT